MSAELQKHILSFKDGGELIYPAYHAQVYQTETGTYYLKEPGVILLAQSVPHLEGLRAFLGGFDENLEFPQYLDDPVSLDPSAQIVKVAGQACYMSFGPKRTHNEDAEDYIGRLIESGHGSVLEHPNFTFLVYSRIGSSQSRHGIFAGKPKICWRKRLEICRAARISG